MAKTAAVLSQGTNLHLTSAADFNRVATNFISQGVVGTLTNTSGVAPASGGFAVNAQGTPNTTSQVSAGIAYVTGTPSGDVSQTIQIQDTVGAAVTHTSNASGSTKYDWIYAKLDPVKMANPAVDASDVFTYVTSRSTNVTTDDGTPPAYGIPIAAVALANNFTTVTNANITDKRVQSGINSIASTAALPNLSATSAKLAPSYGVVNTNTGTLINANTDYPSPSTVSITVPTGGVVLIWVGGWVQVNVAANTNTWLTIDGVKQTASFPLANVLNPSASQLNSGIAINFKATGLSAGVHTFGFVSQCTVANVSQVNASITAMAVGN